MPTETLKQASPMYIPRVVMSSKVRLHCHRKQARTGSNREHDLASNYLMLTNLLF